MKSKPASLSQRYVVALRAYLKGSSRTDMHPAINLGRQAVVIGLDTLELARIHERALIALKFAKGSDKLIKRAEVFFTEALVPIVETHRPARQSKMNFKRLNETLSQRTLELSATNRLLKRDVIRRKSVEAALRKSGEHYSKLLKESLQLQEGLRQLTHRLIAAQESERKKISCDLQDEIAQTLLGINVRLVSLKKEAQNNTKDLKNEIASTQRLVVKSANSVRRVARKFRTA